VILGLLEKMLQAELVEWAKWDLQGPQANPLLDLEVTQDHVDHGGLREMQAKGVSQGRFLDMVRGDDLESLGLWESLD